MRVQHNTSESPLEHDPVVGSVRLLLISEDELTSVDAPENESGEEGGEEDEEEEKEESGEAEADLQPETRWQVMGKGGGTVET